MDRDRFGHFIKGHKVNKGLKRKIEDIVKLRERNIGEKNPYFGKKHTKEWREAASKRNRGRISPMKGRHHTIKARLKNSLSQKCKLSGDKNPQWTGGYSLKYSIDWTRSLRISIRERDRYICQMCGEKQEERAFDIHHIDYDKKNCNPDNLITLCRRCHMRTNYNRNKWIIYLKNKLKTL
jgi:5-methylcytosine-specific restriction endonuclease McrA